MSQFSSSYKRKDKMDRERKQDFDKLITLAFLGLKLRYQELVKECKIRPVA